ncbi:MAG: hypothetical protein RIQ46_560, partial [Pseudomonadota bacterium]
MALLLAAAGPPPRKAVPAVPPSPVPDVQLVELKTEAGTI